MILDIHMVETHFTSSDKFCFIALAYWIRPVCGLIVPDVCIHRPANLIPRCPHLSENLYTKC